MKITIAGIILVLCILIKLLYDERVTKKRNREFLKNSWGKLSEEAYTSEKLGALKDYYLHFKEEGRDIDNITWNDLSMDEVFRYLNHTCCAAGEEYLYCLLRKPLYEETPLAERERLIHFFSEHEEERLSIQTILIQLGKLEKLSLYLYINRLNELKRRSCALHYFCIGGLLGSIAALVCASIGGFPILMPLGVLVGFLFFNIYEYYKRKASVDRYFNTFSYVLKLLWAARKLCDLEIPELKPYLSRLSKAGKAFSRLKRGSGFVTGGVRMDGSPSDLLLDYFRMLFHVDLIKFNHMVVELQKNIRELNLIFETIGLLDSMIAAASFRAWTAGYCIPELTEASRGTGVRPFVHVKGLYHPLVSDAVENTIQEEQSVLLTGSNASGKSTFIKALALNALLSQTIHTAVAKAYRGCYFRILSSMALTDNLRDGESYFIVEIKSLKRILDAGDGALPVLCFVDEVLRGTNTPERIAASSRILRSLSEKNAICFAATHDIELTYILEKFYRNYHFQERIEGKNILFDYKLYQGRAVSRNAIRLLEITGYDGKIVKEASLAVDRFLEKGVWDALA